MAGVVAAGYWYRKNRDQTPLPDEESGITVNLPSTSEQTFLPEPATATSSFMASSSVKHGVVFESPVSDFFVNSENEVLFVQTDGQIGEFSNGTTTLISPAKIQNLISADFSFDGSKILLVYGDASIPKISIFDIKESIWQPLTDSFKSVSWAPHDLRFAALTQDRIITIDTGKKGNPIKEISKFRAQDAALDWAASDKIIIKEKGSYLVRGSVWVFDLKTNALTSAVSEKFGVDTVWSRTGDYALVLSSESERDPGVLRLINSKKEEIAELNFLTVPSKCSFYKTGNASSSASSSNSSSVLMACGIPRDQSGLGNYSLPDDYYMKKFFTQDNFYSIELSTGKVKTLFSENGIAWDGTRLKIFGDKLFFINRYDNRLYGISLD
jgi:hypothetical protein